MFNSKLKQRIVELETTNEQLQEQYNLVHVLLQARQDDCVVLQRELAAVQQPQAQPVDYLEVKEIAAESLRLSIEEKLDFLSSSASEDFSDFFMESLVEGLNALE